MQGPCAEPSLLSPPSARTWTKNGIPERQTFAYAIARRSKELACVSPSYVRLISCLQRCDLDYYQSASLITDGQMHECPSVFLIMTLHRDHPGIV